MRFLKLATYALAGMTSVASLAEAQSSVVTTETRTSNGGGAQTTTPVSKRASNIGPEDTKSNIAPALPASAVGDDATARDYLRAAHDALAAGRTGEAQQSLEMAETRALTRWVQPETANMPDPNPKVTQIRDALRVLGQGNSGRALEIVDAIAN